MHFHPDYDPVTLKNNLLILRMEKEINFNKKRIRRIKYDRTASALAGSVIAVTVLGWGDTDVSCLLLN